MIDATDIKARPTASSLNKVGVPPPRLIGGTKGGHDQQAPWSLPQQRWSSAATVIGDS